MAEANLNVGVEVALRVDEGTAQWLESQGWVRPEQAEQDGVTTRVFAGLHGSAESDVSRVIALHERWVAEGAPPLGTSMARWWDRKLVELAQAIVPSTRSELAEVEEDDDYSPIPADLIPEARPLATGGVYRGRALTGVEAMHTRARQLRTRLRGELADEGAQSDLDELLRMCDVDMKRVFGEDCDC
ncbi:hypothetical protein SEA_WENTWORTH_6 [Streptomyces phage Wentworth]|nr:hypothetical protein SEA_WENTWORTH_6 [Streptomyces phage Wentworth]